MHAEVTAVFARYEHALVHNLVDELDALFWTSAHTVRYGAAENLHGIDAIRAFRAGGQPPAWPATCTTPSSPPSATTWPPP